MSEVILFTSVNCPACIRAKDRIVPIIGRRTDIKFRLIAVNDEPEMATRYDIMSVPTLVVDGRQRSINEWIEEQSKNNMSVVYGTPK